MDKLLLAFLLCPNCRWPWCFGLAQCTASSGCSLPFCCYLDPGLWKTSLWWQLPLHCLQVLCTLSVKAAFGLWVEHPHPCLVQAHLSQSRCLFYLVIQAHYGPSYLLSVTRFCLWTYTVKFYCLPQNGPSGKPLRFEVRVPEGQIPCSKKGFIQSTEEMHVAKQICVIIYLCICTFSLMYCITDTSLIWSKEVLK